MQLARLIATTVLIAGSAGLAGCSSSLVAPEATAAPPAVASADTPRPTTPELLADKMVVGSPAWWDQMKREGRVGGNDN